MFDNFFPNFGAVLAKYHTQLLLGLRATLIIAVCGFLIGLVIGSLVATVKVVPKYKNPLLKILEKIFDFYVMLVRGTPIVVQLLLMYFAILAPLRLPAIIIAIIVFGLNSGAYMSEIIRGGIMSVDGGQLEAGRALGMSFGTSMIKIVIPQAVKNSIPTLGNEFIALLKETSVAGYITVIDITMATQRIVARNYMALVDYIILALFYLVIVAIVAFAIKLIERGLRKSDRHSK